MGKFENMLGEIDLSTSTGLEFGPLTSPMVQKSQSNIFYIDHDTTEGIRQKYKDDANVDCDAIVPIDFVYHSDLSQSVNGLKFDYIVASHVFEHVPNPIKWLNECAAVLNPGGTLCLALPDKRVTFDRPRQITQLSEWVGALLDRRERPSPASVFEAARSALIEAGLPPSRWPFDHAAESLERYIDVHCTICTLESFTGLIDASRDLGLQPFSIAAAFDTEPQSIEFQARLRLPGV
ncbi:methyltransferase domain-containing protein [Rhodopseudomonas palustris]|uniref:Methyltransferase domain-containing protein n=1 Tax=Rhodopseudomonas palustris TaxID=1076 RepID=A0A418V0R3_RHOPL|nr:methyltransferase domain-containing protein [Rhodopseudomonas palustris]RJF69422.1 methyltransferase domain-containing protein [Rhodopseudomonas palustris]